MQRFIPSSILILKIIQKTTFCINPSTQLHTLSDQNYLNFTLKMTQEKKLCWRPGKYNHSNIFAVDSHSDPYKERKELYIGSESRSHSIMVRASAL